MEEAWPPTLAPPHGLATKRGPVIALTMNALIKKSFSYRICGFDEYVLRLLHRPFYFYLYTLIIFG